MSISPGLFEVATIELLSFLCICGNVSQLSSLMFVSTEKVELDMILILEEMFVGDLTERLRRSNMFVKGNFFVIFF